MNGEVLLPHTERNVIPHCTFRPAKLEDIFYMLHRAVEHNMFEGSIYNVYPELKGLLIGINNEEERKEIEWTFFSTALDEVKSEVHEKVLLFQQAWDLIEFDVMSTLAGLVEIGWQKNDESIDVRISINSVCPRYLKLRAFDVSYRQDIEKMKATATHELLHFIYFNKFKEIFPEVPEEEYNRSHLAWHLSEIVPGVILNDNRIQEVFTCNHRSYKQYYEIKVGDESIMEHIQGMYDSRDNFEGFLRKAWEFVNVNKDIIRS